jgi:TnpA family transposase
MIQIEQALMPLANAEKTVGMHNYLKDQTARLRALESASRQTLCKTQ